MNEKPVKIRRKMFGLNQYNKYCPDCFTKGRRSKIREITICSFQRVTGQRSLKKIFTKELCCERDGGPNKANDCGWRYKL